MYIHCMHDKHNIHTRGTYCVSKHTRRHASPTHGSHRQHCTTQLLTHSQCAIICTTAHFITALHFVLNIKYTGDSRPIDIPKCDWAPLIYQEGFTTHAYTTKTEKIRGHWYTKRAKLGPMFAARPRMVICTEYPPPPPGPGCYRRSLLCDSLHYSHRTLGDLYL